MTMKRLLCIISAMNTGGAETFLMKLYRKLDRTKFQMDFCVNAPEKGFYDEEIASMGGRIYCIPCKSSDLSGFRRQLTNVVRDNQYDYVLRITASGAGLMDLKLAKKAGASVCVARSSNSGSDGGIKSFLAHRIGRLLYSRYIDVRIAPSDLAAIYTFGRRAYQRGEVRILHNALDTAVFRFDSAARARIRDAFDIPQDAFVVGHIGRFSQQKNHTFLLEAFAVVHRMHPEAILMLVGDGELRPEVTRQAERLHLSDCVRFCGVRSDVPALLSAMDVFAFPSFYEGMPNTIIEAQATGLPCVLADTITKEADITGLLTYLPLGDAARWANEIAGKRACARRDTSEELKAAGYDINEVCKEFVQMIFGEDA